ncbi:MAG: hypothetical protein JO356_10375 [Acidobacteria bacterium]|nr:hypothetical protein [Acidobacteriota bacterium]
MRKVLPCAVYLLIASANAAEIPIGFLSWDVTQPGAVGQFDIANESGANSSRDSSFPVLTPVALGNLSLTVQFSDSTVRQFAFSDFTLNPFDGLSYESPLIPLGGLNPQPLSASLTGTFLNTTLNLYDGSQIVILPAFAAQVSSSGRPLADGDIALIVAQTQEVQPPPPGIPEPSTWRLLAIATILAPLLRSSVLKSGWRRKRAHPGAGLSEKHPAQPLNS